MSADKAKTSRRAFVMSGGATLGAGVAAAVSASERSASRATAEEREAIRKLHARYIADVESATVAAAAPTHRAYRANARQVEDTLTMTANGRSATATWNVDVKTGMAIEGDSTIAQMARLQGHLGNVQWESGRLEARYEKAEGQWRMTEVRYAAS
jgi:hypothetical protein